jgi:A/G-specific adenine glycosylase
MRDSTAPDPADSLAARLIRWQERHGRHDLPWQGTRDAYRVWLSEIMLQQTRVATVIPYYRRFLARFPDIGALSAAPLEAVLEAWAGLGYYARARHLHRCARVLAARHAGNFPREIAQLAELPGIGRSTAAAIGVFAFGLRAAILDGNVKRVFARHFAIEGFPGHAPVAGKLWQLAESLLPATRIEAYTQGLMDLGATVCTRADPACGACPLQADCAARRDGRQAELPTPRPTRPRPERTSRVLILTDGRRVLLERRPPAGIWGGLLALPEVSGDAAAFARRHGFRPLRTEERPALRHAFTHFRLTLLPCLCEVDGKARQAGEPGWEWLAPDEIGTAALPAPIRRLLRQAGLA